MCCGNGCSTHRPLTNGDGSDVQLGGLQRAGTPSDPPAEPRPVGVETRPNGRWRYGTTRSLTDVTETYDGRHTSPPRVVQVQVEQMAGVVPTPQTAIRRTATRDTGAGSSGGGCK